MNGWRMHALATTNQPPAGAPAIVMAHGIGVASAYFAPTMEWLATDCRLYAPDLPGFGKSDKPEPLSLIELADTLAAWTRHVVDGPVVLLGNSVGCQIVTHCAARHPDLTAGLVLVGPTFDPAARTVGQTLARWMKNNRHEKLSQAPINLRAYARAGLPRLWRMLQDALADPIEETFPAARAPALVVRGGRDPIVPQAWAEEVARLLPEARLVVIPGASHTVNFSAPLELARVMRPFLRDLQRASSGG